MSITQGRSAKNIRKAFQVSGAWNEQLASKLDDLLDTITSSLPGIRYGQYTGNGEVKLVEFAPAVGPPLLVFMADRDTGDGGIVAIPVADGPIVSWDKRSFTLDSSVATNTLGAVYQFVVILQPTE